jgi:multisubunit Na+/H+ antiporter MnhF subunit
VNLWLLCGAAIAAQFSLCLVAALRGSPFERLLGLELGSTIVSLSFLVLAEGYDRSIYFDLALVYTGASFVANLVFVRFLERWV